MIGQTIGSVLLLIIIFVSAFNLGYDINRYLEQIDIAKVQELHIAGHTTLTNSGKQPVKVDTHSTFATQRAWDGLEYVIANPNFTGFAIYEWDSDMPEFDILLDQTKRIREIYQKNVRLSA